MAYEDKFPGFSKEFEQRKADRDGRGGYSGHRDGTCGYMASLCGDCHEEQRAELLAWAREQPAGGPLGGEDHGTYWRRIGGPFYDSWHDVASQMKRDYRHIPGALSNPTPVGSKRYATD